MLVAQSFRTFGHPLDCSIPLSMGEQSSKQTQHNTNTTTTHWPGIEPKSPAWEMRILPLNHQCYYREHICKDSLDGVLFRSFSSCRPLIPCACRQPRLSSSALGCTGCPLPSGLLRVALVGTQVCFGSV